MPEPERHDRTRVLVEALIAALMIAGALAIRDSELSNHRTGALLLLISGALFLTVASGDWWRDRRRSTVKPAGPPKPHPSRPLPQPRVRRIRPATRS